ncbi:MAG: DNA-directed RNA polymerase subunit H [Candidatus Lokiarchaeota archaeon]|nr:DNA-directed RNA polymerase subunit H [Candidatus Lokiarchaeota archaeon]
MDEFPTLVMKTRDLLHLRGYDTEELLEYDDWYAMVCRKEEGEDTIKKLVWVFKEPKLVGIAVVRDIVRYMEDFNAQRGMLVGGKRFTPAAKKHARKTRVELVEGGYASFDLFGHDLVTPHTIASEEEVQLVLDHYGIDKQKLPRIFREDPAVKLLGARPGQVVRIERDSPTAGKTYYYRLVVEPGQ